MFLALLALPVASHAATGPSFDCAHAKSRVNQMICASPELSARDREIAEHYRALAALPGTDLAALRRDEAAWLRDVRDPCPDAACVADAYAVRDAVLQARLRRGAIAAAAASPAASPAPTPAPPPARVPAPTPAPVREAALPPTPVPAPAEPSPPPPPTRRVTGPAADAETQPFKSDAAMLADARSLRGQKCAPGEDVPREPGYVPVPNEWPVVGEGSVVLVRRRFDADFAFLLDTRRGACRMVDVVALPPHSLAGNLLQCAVTANGGKVPLSRGVGLRQEGERPLAYWEIDLAHGQLVRQPLAALGWSDALQCRQPQFGD